MNNRYALRELGCHPLNSHKCLNVFHSKDFSLWDLVKSGSAFTDESDKLELSVNENTSAVVLSVKFVIVANLHAFVSLEPCH